MFKISAKKLFTLFFLILGINLYAEQLQNSCYAIYDAGSSGTRLFIYEQTNSGLVEHIGPKVSAIADPIREIRGKTWSDANSTIDELVLALDTIKNNHEATQFDWENQCNLKSAFVYATAGMRIAELENMPRSKEFYSMLSEKLQKRVGNTVSVKARTISGYEEGLYKWISISKQKNYDDFGLIEVGGASAQITYSCEECKKTDDESFKVISLGDGKSKVIYSKSFLGLGVDEAVKVFGLSDMCTYGVGEIKQDWNFLDCANKISLGEKGYLLNPYTSNKKAENVALPNSLNKTKKWILTGAYTHLSDDAVDNCCMKKGKCHNKNTSCFDAVYLNKFLLKLNVPVNSDKIDVSWGYGAAMCEIDDCLKNKKGTN